MKNIDLEKKETIENLRNMLKSTDFQDNQIGIDIINEHYIKDLNILEAIITDLDCMVSFEFAENDLKEVIDFKVCSKRSNSSTKNTGVPF